MISFSDLGNDLYTGRKSIPVVPKRRSFYLVSLVLMAIAVAGLGINKLNLGLEFSGGSEFRVTSTSVPGDYEAKAREALGAADDSQGVRVSKLGTGTVRVQTERLDDAESAEVRTQLAETFSVPEAQVSATFIGPSWGDSVTKQALRALVIFLVLVAAVLAIYFRNWKMAAAGVLGAAAHHGPPGSLRGQRLPGRDAVARDAREGAGVIVRKLDGGGSDERWLGARIVTRGNIAARHQGKRQETNGNAG